MSVPDWTMKQVTPTDIKIRRAEHQMVVTWKDGHVSTFSLTELRKNCPCASCNSEREKRAGEGGQNPFVILKNDPGVGPPGLMSAQMVGNYAIHLSWSDGHNTGIYDFRLLRSMDRT